ncbi:MAG TPA: 2-oxoglutarate ferredoxin oxidoreductase subunit alpha, partial [Propionibacteriaceae bacterium]|nr:2-oxoglutarate ferredoxin oxidoreductase subunit alpha [Propionibacteriaceae bacterium]
RAAVSNLRSQGYAVARAHVRHLNPFPANLGDVLRQYDRVVVPEMNLGQLAMILRSQFLVDVQSYSRVRGLPISNEELAADIITLIDDLPATDGGAAATKEQS